MGEKNTHESRISRRRLLFSKPGQIGILPALAAEWRTGEMSGLRARGAVEVSIQWDAGSGFGA